MSNDNKKKTLEQLAELDEVDFGQVTGGAVAESKATLLMQYVILGKSQDDDDESAGG